MCQSEYQVFNFFCPTQVLLCKAAVHVIYNFINIFLVLIILLSIFY